MAKADIWMPLYIGDYLADTTRLTTEQHGAYLLLIMDYWRNGAPPDDDAILANITRSTIQAWKRIRPSVIGFFKVSEGKWNHSRIAKEIADAQASKEKAEEKARKAAEARWGNAKPSTTSSNAPSNAPSIDQALLKECPLPSPSPITTKSKAKTTPEGDLFDGIDPQIISDFKAMRSKQRAAITKTAIDGIRREAEKAGLTLADALKVCCERNWRGFNADWLSNPQKAATGKPSRHSGFNQTNYSEGVCDDGRIM